MKTQTLSMQPPGVICSLLLAASLASPAALATEAMPLHTVEVFDPDPEYTTSLAPFRSTDGLLVAPYRIWGGQEMPAIYEVVDDQLVGPRTFLDPIYDDGSGSDPDLYDVDADGDTLLVLRRHAALDFYDWDVVVETYVHRETLELPDLVITNTVRLEGDHLVVSSELDLTRFYHRDPFGQWVLSMELPHTTDQMWLQGDRASVVEHDGASYPVALRTYTFDRTTDAWNLADEQDLTSGFFGNHEPVTWDDAGNAMLVERQYCLNHLYLDDGLGNLVRAPDLIGPEWITCYEGGIGGQVGWAFGTWWSDFPPVLFRWDAPEPMRVAELPDVFGSYPVVSTFLSGGRVVVWDWAKETGRRDGAMRYGMLSLWQLSGPPRFQVHPPSLLEGGGVVLGPDAVYVMDPDHPLPDVPLTLTVAPTNGTLSLDGTPLAEGASVDAQAWMDGRVTYDHDGSETTTDAFAIQGCDPDATCSDELVVDVVITPVNDLPVPSDDALTVPEGGQGLVDVLANDTDADSVLDLLGVAVEPPSVGTAVVQTDGVAYTHDGSEPGPDPVLVAVTVCDPEGACSPSTLAVTVTPVNDPPVATDDAATIDEGGTVVVDVLANDVDPDDDLPTAGTLSVLSGPVHGTATVLAGALEVQHDGAETPSDTVVYEVCDAAGACSEAVLQLAVAPVNDAPTLADDTLTVDPGGTGTVAPLANDIDVDGVLDPSTLSVATPPAYGTVSIDGDTLAYTHDGTATGSDAFAYTACDDGGACAEATVQVSIPAVPGTDGTDPTGELAATPGTGDEKAGCGCASGRSVGWLGLAPLALAMRRRVTPR